MMPAQFIRKTAEAQSEATIQRSRHAAANTSSTRAKDSVCADSLEATSATKFHGPWR